MITTIDAAETTLPELLHKLQPGDTVLITSGTSKTPIAKVEGLETPNLKLGRFSVLEPSGMPLSDAALAPLDEEDLGPWEDGGPDDPLNWSKERIEKENAAANARYTSAS